VRTCSFPCPPAGRPAPGAGPAPLVREAASAAPQPVRMRSGGPGLASTLVRAMHGQRSTIPSQPGPIRAATTKPLGDHSDTSNPLRQRGLYRRSDVFRIQRGAASAVRPARTQRPRTPDAWLSGHPHYTGRVDTGRLDTGRPPDQLDGRPSAWRTEDADRATNGVAGVRTSWTATTAAAGWAAQTSLGLQRLRRSAADDGSAVTTPAAAVTGQLRSTARDCSRASAHCSPQTSFGSRVERTARLHPLWRARSGLPRSGGRVQAGGALQ
jgi:hypothetical protein